MADIDWLDASLRKVVRVEQVSQTNIDDSYGPLDGVRLDASSIEAGYYTDTRTAGTIKVVGDEWIRNSFIRVIIELPDHDWSREIGTYLVSSDDSERKNGEWIYNLKLKSLLYALSTDLAVRPWTVAKNATVLNAARQILNTCGRKFVINNATDYKVRNAVVMPSGDSYLSRLFSLCDTSNNRLDVDGHGRVTISKYVVPDAKTPVFTFDLSDPRGVSEDSISRTTDYLSMPGRVVVSYKYQVQQGNKSQEREIVSSIDATGHASSKVRGYMVTKRYSVSDMTPATQAKANSLAKSYMNLNSKELVEYEFQTPYLPIWEGDVVELVIPDGISDYTGKRKCLVKNVELDLSTLMMNLTLKETASGDEED